MVGNARPDWFDDSHADRQGSFGILCAKCRNSRDRLEACPWSFYIFRRQRQRSSERQRGEYRIVGAVRGVRCTSLRSKVMRSRQEGRLALRRQRGRAAKAAVRRGPKTLSAASSRAE